MRIQLEEQDYVSAVAAASAPTRKVLIGVAIGSVAILVGALLGWWANCWRESTLLVCGWFGGVGGALLGQRIVVAPKARRIFRQLQAARRPYHLSWDEQGVTVSNYAGTVVTPWSDFHKSRDLDHQFMLFFSDASFLLVPKRDFPNESVLEAFGQLLDTRVPRG